MFEIGAEGGEQPVQGGASVSHQAVDGGAVREGDTRVKAGGEQVPSRGPASPSVPEQVTGGRGVIIPCGRSRLSADDYVEGSPELIVEIAASSASHDLHDKMRAYRRNGVREYLVWRVYEKQFDWFVLADDVYGPLTPDASGLLHSQVFPGLCLAVEALLSGDVAGVLAALQTGVGTPEHAAFVGKPQAGA